ncbi:hypothetical protein DOY81_000467 [Sarcophaga bullata]|nr:hypothetical protein DOY81_000467 [Sarcophaga bullata]
MFSTWPTVLRDALLETHKSKQNWKLLNMANGGGYLPTSAILGSTNGGLGDEINYYLQQPRL